MIRQYITKNITSTSILLFVIIFSIINYYKPSFLYNSDGSIRDFGLNSSKKTVVPVWLLTLLTAMFSYLVVLYYVSMPKIMY